MINLKKTLLAALVAFSASSALASAVHEDNFYAGGGLGYGHAQDVCDNINGVPGVSCSDNTDDMNMTWTIFGGYQFNPNFAVEAGYSDLGTYSAKLPGFAYGSYSATAYDLSALGILPIGDMFSVYVRGGYSLLNANTRFNFAGTAGNFDDGGSEGVWVYGAGVGVQATDNIDVRADWKRYNDADNNSTGSFASGSSVGLSPVLNSADLDIYSLQVVYHFGSKPAPMAPAEQVSLNIQVLFDTAKSNIKPEYQGEIQKAVDFLNAHPEAKAVIEGHTDSVGGDAYNQGLSERRANSVMNALVAKGIAADRLSAVGYGESKPVASNATAEGRQQNRRVVAEFEGVSIKAE